MPDKQDPPIVTDRRPFSRREWLLTVALVCIGEFLILWFAFLYGATDQVVGFVSFAATIASLLLAVIAITFAFYQSESQQRHSVAITQSVESMRAEVGSLRHARERIDAEVERIASVTNAIDKIGVGIAESRSELSSLREEVQRLGVGLTAKVGEAEQGVSRHVGETWSAMDVARLVLRRTTFDADLLCYALSKAPETSRSYFHFLYEKYAKPVARARQDDQKEPDLQRVFGYVDVGMQVLSALRAVGLLEMNPDEKSLRISPSLRQILPTLALEIVAIRHAPVQKALPLIDAAFASDPK